MNLNLFDKIPKLRFLGLSSTEKGSIVRRIFSHLNKKNLIFLGMIGYFLSLTVIFFAKYINYALFNHNSFSINLEDLVFGLFGSILFILVKLIDIFSNSKP